MVAFHRAIDDIGEPAFEGAAGLGGCLSFGDFAAVIVLSESGVSDLAGGHNMQYAIESTVAAGVESVPDGVAAGRFQWCAAGVAREVMLGGKAVDVSDVSEDFGSKDDAHSSQFCERGSGGAQRVTHLGLVVFDRAVEATQVGDKVTGEVASAAVGRS